MSEILNAIYRIKMIRQKIIAGDHIHNIIMNE